MADSDVCPRCGEFGESTLHTLRDCAKVKEIWNKVLNITDDSLFYSGDVPSWFSFNLRNQNVCNDMNWNTAFAVTVWHVWSERNNLVFRGKHISAEESFWKVRQYVNEVMFSNSKLASMQVGKRTKLIGWSFPENDWIKCNTDGACLEGGLRIGCGGVFRDSSGNWIFGFTRHIGEGSVLTAELWGIVSGLEIAWDTGYRKIWIESDSLTSVNLIKNGCSKLRSYYALVHRAVELLARDWEACISHHHREGNRVADSLANSAANNVAGLTLFPNPPNFCIPLLRDDLSGTSFPRSIAF